MPLAESLRNAVLQSSGGADLPHALQRFWFLVEIADTSELESCVYPAYRKIAQLHAALGRIGDLPFLIDDIVSRRPDLMFGGPPDFAERKRAAAARGIRSFVLFPMPKSASNYVFHKLLGALDLPASMITTETYPADDFVVPQLAARIGGGGAFGSAHSAYHPDNVDILAANGITHCVVMIRDPRQALVSALHHWNRLHEQGIPQSLPDDWGAWTQENKIDYMFETVFPLFCAYIAGWAKAWAVHRADFNILMMTQEQLASSEATFFERLANFVAPGATLNHGVVVGKTVDESNFRSGLTDEWRHLLTRKQQDLAARMISEAFDDPEQQAFADAAAPR